MLLKNTFKPSSFCNDYMLLIFVFSTPEIISVLKRKYIIDEHHLSKYNAILRDGAFGLFFCDYQFYSLY